MHNRSPKAILDDANLSKAEKIKQLKEMLLDERLKAIAEDENMRPDIEEHSDEDMTPEIIECLTKLGEQPPFNDDSASK
ncbi:MAG: hypothetical protein GY821_04030 [Gammaproteobacteria bacterium]|nr:hypothetical protein [Gammaproteobacteria bacterium]